MQVMVTLPDTLVSRLNSLAKRKNLTFNEFLLKILQEDRLISLESKEYVSDSVNGEYATSDVEAELYPTSPFHFAVEETLTDVVQRIQARPPNLANIHPPTKTIDQLVDDLAENPPEESEFGPTEWDQMWAEFEDGMKISAREKAKEEGRV